MRKTAMVVPVEKTYLSTAELKKYLDCSDEFVEKLRNEAKLSFFRMGNKIWYLKNEVDKIILKHKVI